MERTNPSARRRRGILLLAEAGILALLTALRACNVFSFRLSTLPKLLLLFFALDAALWLIGYDRRRRADAAYRRKRGVLLLLLGVALLASAPLTTNYLPKGHDIQFHLFRIEGVRDGLFDGQFPVRIHPNTLYGNGYANPTFYPELLLYFPALLRLAGFSVMGAYKAFLFALNLMTALFSYYACARIFRSVKLGVFGSAFYTLSLYRLVNLYTRAAIGEASAMTFLPLVAAGLCAILFDDTDRPAYKRAFLPLLAGMTGLFGTHLLSCEITLPLLAIFCLVFWRRTFSKKRLPALIAAAVGTALLSLAFLAPMLDYMGYDAYNVFGYSTANLAKEAVNVTQLFPLLPNAVGESNAAAMGARGEMPLGAGFACLAVLLLYPALRRIRRAQNANGREGVRVMRFCYIAALALFFMSTNLFPWQWLYDRGGAVASVAGLLQFPWRLLSLATLMTTLIACECVSLLPQVENAPLRRAAAYTLCLLLLITGVAYNDRLTQTGEALFIHANTDLDQTRSVGDAEYLPEGAAGASEYRIAEPTRVGGGLTITDFVRRGTTITFFAQNASASEKTADLPLIAYLGYRAEDDAGNALTLSKGAAARLCVAIPAGYVGGVTVRFLERALWRVAEGVTLLTAIALVGWTVFERRRFGAEAIVDYAAPISMLE